MLAALAVMAASQCAEVCYLLPCHNAAAVRTAPPSHCHKQAAPDESKPAPKSSCGHQQFVAERQAGKQLDSKADVSIGLAEAGTPLLAAGHGYHFSSSAAGVRAPLDGQPPPPAVLRI